jgi:hypothetical protein
MHFATLIPDWNSLDSVRRAHSDLEAAALVFFALLVLFDILAHLSTENKKKTLLEKIGLYCFAVAVLAEVVAYPYGQRNDTLSGKAIGSLDAETREALIKSGTALAQSKEAETKSGDAIDKAGKAQVSFEKTEDEASRAQTASSNALTLARGARKEADSFEKDIASAKQLAADAESHLAEALQKAVDATAELNRLKSPRTVSNASVNISALQAYKGTEYTFVGVFSDAESLALLRQIDSLLQLAGWKRVQAQIPGGQRFGFENISILPIVSTGVRIEVESTEKIEVLRAKPMPLLPAYIQAGMVLKSDLAAAISPEDEGLKTKDFNVEQGTSTAVRLWIGQKQ